MADYFYSNPYGDASALVAGPMNTLARYYAELPMHQAQAANIRSEMALRDIQGQETLARLPLLSAQTAETQARIPVHTAQAAQYNAGAALDTAKASHESLTVEALKKLSDTGPQGMLDFAAGKVDTPNAKVTLGALAQLFAGDANTGMQNFARALTLLQNPGNKYATAGVAMNRLPEQGQSLAPEGPGIVLRGNESFWPGSINPYEGKPAITNPTPRSFSMGNVGAAYLGGIGKTFSAGVAAGDPPAVTSQNVSNIVFQLDDAIKKLQGMGIIPTQEAPAPLGLPGTNTPAAPFRIIQVGP